MSIRVMAAALVWCVVSHAQGDVFRMVDQPPAPTHGASVPGPRPTAASVVHVDVVGLEALLADAPMQRLDAKIAAYGKRVTLPHPSGRMVECYVAQAPVMEEALQARYPGMRTYIARSVDGSAAGRFELTQRGLTAMLRTVDGHAWMIDPWNSGDASHAAVYFLRDLPGGGDWTCETVADGANPSAEVADVESGYQPRAVQVLRTYRMAMACTGEYGVYHSLIQGREPNVADPLAAIVTVIARTNVVYESDLAVRFLLVANNDQLIFLDPATDPYDATCSGGGGSDCSGPLLGANIATVNERIGSSNYDLGHVVTRIFGGVAYLPAVCTGIKAGAVSGIPRGGDVDPFSALVVIHEIGHQFGANHTFSGTRGRCAGNVNLSTAWEAGSGSSPMAYAGGCPVGDLPPSDNVVQFADPFFHNASIAEMRANIAGGGGLCPAVITTANNIPEIVTPSNITIPPLTPFTLTVTATDADGDVLTYSWEQHNAGVARPLDGEGSLDTGSGALFRIFPPVLSPTRVFPQWSGVLAGGPVRGEQLPSVTGTTRRFRVVVRDNEPGMGGTAISSTVLAVLPQGLTPFAVLTPTEGAVVRAGPASVAWTTGGTNTPTGVTTVRVRLSTDGGATFPIDLGLFPNTGAAVVALPESDSSARIMIEASNGSFFAVSRPFSLRYSCTADFDRDGDTGTDQDIEAFFRCLAGDCCPTCPTSSDFDADGDVGTDQDIEAFFRVLAGGAC